MDQALCAEGDYTLSLFSSMWNSSSCTCSSVSPASTALIPALAGAKDPSCSSEATTVRPHRPLTHILAGKTDAQATLLSPGWTFDSCSYASSTTAQFASASNSSSACLDACAGYPYTYVFPTVSGWNCYCAMSGGGAGQTACADNTFYAYAAVKEEARRSRL